MELFEFNASELARALRDTNAGSPLVGLKVDLTKESVPITSETVIGDLTAVIANFAGYAQGVVTWDLPSISSDGTVEVVGNLAVWRPTDGVTPNNIYNIYMTGGVSGDLLFAGLLDDAPVPMTNALSQLLVTVRYRPATKSLVVSID